MTKQLQVEIDGWNDGERIPERFAMGKPGDPAQMSDNVSPAIRWSGAPEGTRSFAIIMSDPDVPSVGDDVNQADREVPADLPRVPFSHWVLIDLPASVSEIAEAAASSGVTPKGKDVGPSLGGIAGANDYTGWFDGDPDMGGVYGGYDGPFPPWNDSIIHHYNFEVFALDVESLGIDGADLTRQSALDAMDGHVLASGVYSGTYWLNQRITG